MKSSYLINGIRFSRLFRLLFRNGISILPKYLGRFLFLFQGSIWASIFKYRERKKFGEQIKNTKLPEDPIIIVGHWRTGSTYLHQLFNLDPDVTTPSVFQASIPDSFLTSRKSFEPVMGKMLKGSRPMDQVKLGMDEPLEDEYAIFRLSTISPLERLVFPKNKTYFLLDDKDFLPDDQRMREQWQESFELFYKKMVISKRGVLVMKNPFHSLRIPQLLKIFPRARFINITRNPEKVIPSTQRMWDIVGRQNCMNRKWKTPKMEEVAQVYKYVVDTVDKELSEIPDQRKYNVSFNDLEKSPIVTVDKIYKHFGLNISDEFLNNLKQFIEGNKSYKKNKYELSEENKSIINSVLQSKE